MIDELEKTLHALIGDDSIYKPTINLRLILILYVIKISIKLALFFCFHGRGSCVKNEKICPQSILNIYMNILCQLIYRAVSSLFYLHYNQNRELKKCCSDINTNMDETKEIHCFSEDLTEILFKIFKTMQTLSHATCQQK
jgi:hypothetical protein